MVFDNMMCATDEDFKRTAQGDVNGTARADCPPFN